MTAHNATLFYVEDNQSDVLLLEQAFEDRLFRVKVTSMPDFDDALHYLRIRDTARDAPPPDVILLDHYILKGDGAELLKFIGSSDVLRKIPTFLYASPHVAEAHRIDPAQCLRKATDWHGVLGIADRLMEAIHAYRRTN